MRLRVLPPVGSASWPSRFASRHSLRRAARSGFPFSCEAGIDLAKLFVDLEPSAGSRLAGFGERERRAIRSGRTGNPPNLPAPTFRSFPIRAFPGGSRPDPPPSYRGGVLSSSVGRTRQNLPLQTCCCNQFLPRFFNRLPPTRANTVENIFKIFSFAYARSLSSLGAQRSPAGRAVEDRRLLLSVIYV